ncbi:MAG: hypothetical protein KUG78_20285 [Kangiellaceae bacterium]|nr:hypothetical protein [Kangiellaceae bacterium]
MIFLIAFFFVTACSTVNDEKVVQLRQATFVFSDHQTPPAFNKNEEVTLPHNWNKSGLHGSAWYQVGFAVNEINPKETWSVFLPQVIMNAQVWLNGHVIGSGGSLEAPVARYWHTPLMLSFPTSLLKENNTLHIRLVGYTNQHAKLGIVELGPEALIQKRYSVKYFKAVTLNVISGVFTVLVGILLFSIWFKRRESEYFWFAISSVTWSLYSINIFTINIPISEEYWEKIVFLSSGWLAISIAFLLVRLDQFYYPKIESGLLLVSAILNVLVLVSPEQYMFSIFPIWLQFSFLVGCSGIGHFAWRWIVDRKKQSGIILMMILGIAMAGAHDIAVQSGWLEIGNILWLDYSLPLFFIAMSYLLVSRFLLALEEKESLNLDLENRVAEAGNLLEQNYRKILFMEKQQATTNERERIHRDLHDSIGAKLLSLVYRSENESEAELARSALTDLRNVVHQAPVSEQSLLEAVYEWELNCVERCLEAGRSVDFYIHHVPQTIDLAKSRIHNLAAILSEALTNSFRHSDSRNIRISIRYRLGALRFEVGEIGHFKNQRNWVEGCGMQNMRYRVEQLNGKITWQQSNRINRVIWTFPIEVKNNEE